MSSQLYHVLCYDDHDDTEPTSIVETDRLGTARGTAWQWLWAHPAGATEIHVDGTGVSPQRWLGATAAGEAGRRNLERWGITA